MTVEQMIEERDTRIAALSAALTTALAAANTVKGGTASASVSGLADDLATELAAANAAVSTKGGTGDATNINGLADAIGTIPQGGGQPYEEITFTSAVIIENGYNGMKDFWSNYIQDISGVYAILCDMKYKQTYQFLGSISDAKNTSMTSGSGPVHLSYRTSMWSIVTMDSYNTYTIPAGTVFRVYRKWW